MLDALIARYQADVDACETALCQLQIKRASLRRVLCSLTAFDCEPSHPAPGAPAVTVTAPDGRTLHVHLGAAAQHGTCLVRRRI